LSLHERPVGALITSMGNSAFLLLQVSKAEVYTGLAPEQRCLLERREAEQILCILSILSSIFTSLEATDCLTTPDLEADLKHLIHQHPYIQVLS
jgi:hypothetical protein